MKRANIYGLLFIFLIIISYPLLLVYVPSAKVWNLIREDGIIENLQVVFPFMAACLFFYIFFKSKSKKEKYLFGTKRNYFYLLLGIFSLIIVGEEINWGQRLFNMNTPDWIFEKGLVEEINVHNQGPLFYLFGIPVTAGRIYFLACILFFLFIPIVNQVSRKAKDFFQLISLPIVPIFIAIYFMVNISSWQIADKFLNINNRWKDLPEYAFGQTAMECDGLEKLDRNLLTLKFLSHEKVKKNIYS